MVADCGREYGFWRHIAFYMLLSLFIFIFSFTISFAVGNREVPTGANVVGGTVMINSPVSGELDITQTTDRAVINWDSFNIGRQATVEFLQPNASSLAVNRVVGASIDPSHILGDLISNGRVMILDHNGVLFDRQSTIDVAGLIVATGDVSTSLIMSGANVFDINDFGSGSIIARGDITVADAGMVAFVSPYIVHSGVINARLGSVGMAAADVVTLDLYGDELFEIAIDNKTADALIEHSGKIYADGGFVLITAQAAKSTIDHIINMDGLIVASDYSSIGGKIVLRGGVGGTVSFTRAELDTSGTEIGTIEVSGENVVVGKNTDLISSGDVIIAVSNSFINEAGSDFINTNSIGRWLIYSPHPDSNIYDGLNSSNTAVWNKNIGDSVLHTGNRYVFAYQPSALFTYTDIVKTVGGASFTAYTIDGLHRGVSEAFLGDTFSTAFSGVSNVVPSTADVIMLSYPFDLLPSNLYSPSGYAIDYRTTGKVNLVPPSPIFTKYKRVGDAENLDIEITNEDKEKE